MTETLSIPLNKLSVWSGNVRKTGAGEAIDELAASIESHGLLQPLIVRKEKRGRYAVVAGQRRLMALALLASQERVAVDMPVTCVLTQADADAGELSLAENVVRLAMHPADQFESFRDLVDRGVDAASVARRFGITEAAVLKRLKLGRLSPVVLEAYRNGDVDLDEAQAFAITDDHAAQERVLADLPDWNRSPRMIRSLLTEDELPASDKRVRFVSVEAYEKAGGLVRRDLFDDSHSGTILNPALLETLVKAKLMSIADDVRAEGWSWVEIEPMLDRGMLAAYRRSHPDQRPVSEEQQAEIDTLSATYDELADSSEADDGDEGVLSRLEAIELRLDEIEQGRLHWPEDVLAKAGAIISIGYVGDVAIERGLMCGDDDNDSEAVDIVRPDNASNAGISAALVIDLTSRKTAALQCAISKNVDIMVVAVVHALTLQAFYRHAGERSCLTLSVQCVAPERSMAVSDAFEPVQTMAAHHEEWARRLPEDPADLWQWCLSQKMDVLLALLAHIGARSIDAVRQKGDRADHPRLVHADALGDVAGFDIGAHYTPDVATYFSRVSSAQIVTALCEAKGVAAAPAWSRMKKSELAALAAREVAGTGWLPEAIRPRVVDALEEAA